MKRHILVLALLMFFPIIAGAQQATFTLQPPPEGLTRSMVDSMELVFLISVNVEGADQSFDVTQAEKKDYVETILAVDGSDITKRRVAFTEATERSTQPMQATKTKTLPISGKAYVLEYIGDSLAITADDGSEVSQEEYDKLVGSFGRSTANQFNVLNGRTMSVGEELELTDDMLKQFGSELLRGGMKPTSAKIKLVSIRESEGMKTALLDIVLVMGGTQGVMELEFSMKGTAEVGVDNLWPLSVSMLGTVTGAGSHSGMPLTADGEMRIARTVHYK